MQYAVPQRCRQRQQKDARAADHTAFRACPAGQLAHHGQDVLADAQHGRQRRKHHEQKEQCAPPAAPGHVVENAGHRVKQQAWPGSDFQPVGEAGREDDDARQHRHKGVQRDDVQRLAHEGALLADVAAEDCHAAHADGQRKKRLVHGRHDDAAVDFGKIRHKVEPQPLGGSGKGQAVDGQHQHQHQQRCHHVLGHAFQPALQVEAEQYERRHDHRKQIGHVDFRVGEHLRKAEIGVVPSQEFDKIVQNPAGDDRVKRHDGNVADQAEHAEHAPFVAGLFQTLVHINGACLRRAAHGQFHDHGGQAQHQKAEDVQQHKAAAAVLAAHPGEFPYIAAADGAPGGQHDKAQAAAQALAFVHWLVSFSVVMVMQTISVRPWVRNL